MRAAFEPRLRRQAAAGRRWGVAAAELAILLPFLLFVLALTVDFCRVYYHAQVVQACAEVGAMYASETVKRNPDTTSSDSDAAIQAAVEEGATLQPPLTANNVSVTVTNNLASVTITYQLNTITSVPGIPSTLTVTRTVKMPVAPQVGQ
jgi:Flp pilus assembly protein TadG